MDTGLIADCATGIARGSMPGDAVAIPFMRSRSCRPVTMIHSLDLALMLTKLSERPLRGRSDARVRSEALAMIGREAPVRLSFCYRIFPVRSVRGEAIDFGDAVLDASALAAQAGELTAVAAAACTLGSSLQKRVSALFAMRRRSLALALDTLANELLFCLADRATASIAREARRAGLGTGMEASPGDPGVALDQQPAVLELADAARIGLCTTAKGMLSPVKSLSFLLALGPNLRRRSAPGRCGCCPSRDRCAVK